MGSHRRLFIEIHSYILQKAITQQPKSGNRSNRVEDRWRIGGESVENRRRIGGESVEDQRNTSIRLHNDRVKYFTGFEQREKAFNRENLNAVGGDPIM